MLGLMITRQSTDATILLDALTSHLDDAFNQPGQIAVFDADGTLWRDDATESLLRYLESLGLITPPEGYASIDAALTAMYETSYVDACRYCASAFSGHGISDVMRWSEQSFARYVLPTMIPLTNGLIQWMQQRNAEVHVISASPWWAILPGTRRLGISDDHVHALNVHMQDDHLTEQSVGRIQSGLGKAKTASSLHSAPIFVAGNTVDDADMMRLATSAALAVEPQILPDDPRDLASIGCENGWFILRKN